MEAIIQFIIGQVMSIGETVAGILTPKVWLVVSILYYAVLLVIFLFSDLFGGAADFKRALIKSNKFLSTNVVDDTTIVQFNKLIGKCPDSVRMGWNYYKQNKIGYPSEFITEYDCLRVPMVGNKKKNFLSLYVLFASLFELVSLGIMAWTGAPNTVPATCFSLLLSVIGYTVLVLVLNRGQAKLFRLFRRFQVLLDDKVEIFDAKNVLSYALSEKGVSLVAAEREQMAKAEELAKFIKKVETACADSETTKDELVEIKKRLINLAVENTEEKASAIIIGAIKSVDGALATRE